MLQAELSSTIKRRRRLVAFKTIIFQRAARPHTSANGWSFYDGTGQHIGRLLRDRFKVLTPPNRKLPKNLKRSLSHPPASLTFTQLSFSRVHSNPSSTISCIVVNVGVPRNLNRPPPEEENFRAQIFLESARVFLEKYLKSSFIKVLEADQVADASLLWIQFSSLLFFFFFVSLLFVSFYIFLFLLCLFTLTTLPVDFWVL